MIDRYKSKVGVIFAFVIALLTTVLPRIIRLDIDQPLVVLANFLYLSVTFLFYWLTHHFFLLHLRSGTFANRYLKAMISIVVSVTVIAFLAWLLHIASPFPIFKNSTGIPERGQARFVRIFRGLIVSTLTWFAVYYYRLLFLLQRSRLENEYLKQENLQAQLTSMRQQISPHFLFNSLNTLSTLSREEAVKEYILKLSEVYRYVLHYQEQNIVSIRDELAFIRSYIYILESRFEEGLKVNIQLNPDCLNRKILPFALQLLVENAVKHNAISYTDPLSIDIYDKGDSLIVENDLRPRLTMEDGYGMGLHNLAERYRLTTDKEIVIIRETSKFKVKIPLLV
ncbi:sensor histidine kinase [Puia sp.]|jgi:sensor histidine kinase YesM|uniref:sensor histidine kinase n=1 Tax=Puia sp. TaxID=2045100 RepID=UPI002F3F037E